MTTEQSMLIDRGTLLAYIRSRAIAGAMVFAALVAISALSGCAQQEVLSPPQALMAPYDTSKGEVLWAVVPLRNESGTSIVDPLVVSDKVVNAASQVRGVRCLPLNRTIMAMRSLDLVELTSPDQAEKLAAALGADGIIVGSVTSYDPYNPPKLGLALALYTRPGLLNRPSGAQIDTRQLTFQPTDYRYFTRSGFQDAPASVISEFLDGRNHQVLMDVKQYADGRSDPKSALGWKRYVASMDLFCEFGAWHSVNRLLEHEWIRVARIAASEPTKQP